MKYTEPCSRQCGHATIAIGRLLADHVGSRSSQLLPEGWLDDLEHDLRPDGGEVYVNLHVPCGVVRITVPVRHFPSLPSARPHWESNPNQPISYISTPSFVTGVAVQVKIPGIGSDEYVTVDIAYGGAFYLIVGLGDLDFPQDAFMWRSQIPQMVKAAISLRKDFLNYNKALKETYLRHPQHRQLEDLYGVIITSRARSQDVTERDVEIGLCVFANGQVDRSPTGSGVQARVALAQAKGEIKPGKSRTYHSLVSDNVDEYSAFKGEVVEEVDAGDGRKGVIVKVSGRAKYTGCSTIVTEARDKIGGGFVFNELGRRSVEDG